MTIRIATFNAENLFRRPTVFGLDDDERRKEILDDFNELVGLLDKEIYQDSDKERVTELIVKHDAHNSQAGDRRPFFINQPRGGAKLFTVPSRAARPSRSSPRGAPSGRVGPRCCGTTSSGRRWRTPPG